jgi:hypothetical protein
MKRLYPVLAMLIMTGCASLTDRRVLIDMYYYTAPKTGQVILAFYDDSTDRTLLDCSQDKKALDEKKQYVIQIYHTFQNKAPLVKVDTDPESGYTLVPLTVPGFKPGVDVLYGKDFDGIYPIPFRSEADLIKDKKKEVVKRFKTGRAEEPKTPAPAPVVADDTWSGSNLTAKAQAFVAGVEPDLSKYQRRMGAVIKGGGTLEVQVRYDLKKGNTADQLWPELWPMLAFLLVAGVIDPTKVTRFALQNAASVAALLLTTQCMIADKPDEKGAGGGMPGMPPGGGYPGMGM